MTAFTRWLACAGALILAGIVVPYGILSGGAASLAILLFWCVFALAVVALIAVGVSGWRG